MCIYTNIATIFLLPGFNVRPLSVCCFLIKHEYSGRALFSTFVFYPSKHPPSITHGFLGLWIIVVIHHDCWRTTLKKAVWGWKSLWKQTDVWWQTFSTFDKWKQCKYKEKQFFSDKFSHAQRVIQKFQILNALQQPKFWAKFKTEIFAVRLPF